MFTTVNIVFQLMWSKIVILSKANKKSSASIVIKVLMLRQIQFMIPQKKSLHIWSKFIKCEIFHLSLRESAKLINVSTKTASIMRHKFQKAISKYVKTLKLSGENQMNPTYVKINLTGTKIHKMSIKSKKYQ